MYLRSRSANRRRRGAFAAWFVLLLPLLAAAFALAIETANGNQRKVELQNGVDAAALAGANAEQRTSFLDTITIPNVFISEVLLTARSDRVALTAANVRSTASAFAAFHAVAGSPITLDTNPANLATGGIVLGTLDGPTASLVLPDLTAAPVDANLYNPFLNAIQIAATQSNVSSSALVYLDRDVIGFRVNGSSDSTLGAEPAIPVVPLGIFSDFVSGTDPGSWEHNIIRRAGVDAFALSSAGAPTSGIDGIPEITVTFSGLATDNGQMLAIQGGGPTTAVAVSQVTTGITASQLNAFDPVNQHLSLSTGSDNQLTLPRLVPAGSSDFATLAANLNSILGQRRVWLLYDTPNPTDARVVGFVAARVMQVTPSPSSVQVVLQPTMLLTSTALTDRTRRALGPRTVAASTESGGKTIYNPYIANVRVLK